MQAFIKKAEFLRTQVKHFESIKKLEPCDRVLLCELKNELELIDKFIKNGNKK